MMTQNIPKIRNNDQFRKFATFDKNSHKLDNIKENINVLPNTPFRNTINSYNEMKICKNINEKNYIKYKKRNNNFYYFSPFKTNSDNNNRNKFIIKSNIQNNLFKSFEIYKITPKKNKLDFKNFFFSLSQKNSMNKFNDSINCIRRLDKLYLDCLKRTVQKFYLYNFDTTKDFFEDFKSDKNCKYVTIDDITKYLNSKIFLRLSKNEIRNIFHVVSNQIDFDKFIKIFHLEKYNKNSYENNNESIDNNINNENIYVNNDENKNESNGSQIDDIFIKDEYDLKDFCTLSKKILKSISDEICKHIFEIESDKKSLKISINALIRKYYFVLSSIKFQKNSPKDFVGGITVFNLSKYDSIENSDDNFLKTNKIINLKLVLKYLAEKTIVKQNEINNKPKIINKIVIKDKIKDKNKDKYKYKNKYQIEEKKENNNKISYIQKIFSYDKKDALAENKNSNKNLQQDCSKNYKTELPYFLPFEKSKNNRKIFTITSNNELFLTKDKDKKQKNKNEDILKYL